METNLTLEEAREIITSDTFDGYGSMRLYGVIGEGDSAGQLAPIKSLHHLTRFNYSRVYAKTNNGVPIFKK